MGDGRVSELLFDVTDQANTCPVCGQIGWAEVMHGCDDRVEGLIVMRHCPDELENWHIRARKEAK